MQHQMILENLQRFCKVCKEDKNWSHLGLALKIPFFLDITTFEDKQMRLK